VFHKKTKKFYALKEMSKAKIIDKKSEKSVVYEKELLRQLKHPYILYDFIYTI
jgi:serine/threonine kinase 32